MEANALRTDRAAVVLAAVIAAFLAAAAQAQPAHAIRQSADLQFHYGVVPAELVLRHPEQHPERPGADRAESAEFEHRVPGPGRAR